MSRVLITGASGFLGAALASRLRADGDEVVGIDRAADSDRGVVPGDTTAPEAWSSLLAECDAVIHTAAVVSNAVDLNEQWRVNVLGTQRVFAAARVAGVARVVHLSSVRAFSDIGFPDSVTEEHPVRPDGSPYVDTKIASEHVALSAHAGSQVQAVVIRPGDVYGPGSVPWILKPIDAIRSGQFLLPAMGRGIHSPVYVDDLVEGVLLALRSSSAAGQIFTITGPRGVSSREYFAHLYRMLGRRGPVCIPTAPAVAIAHVADAINRARGQRSDVNAISMRYLARTGTYSIDKAQRILGYAPAVDLEEGMRSTEEWLRAEGLLGPPPTKKGKHHGSALRLTGNRR
jgi:nucleoside-diphosphate-sugar epimerase